MAECRCWVWHRWERWKLETVIVHNLLGEKVVEQKLTVQCRTCERCGLLQRRKLEEVC